MRLLHCTIVALIAGCAPFPRQSSAECTERYSTADLKRWRSGVRTATANTPGVNLVGVYARPCMLIGIEAESIRPMLDRELKRQGVPLDAVQVSVGRFTFD